MSLTTHSPQEPCVGHCGACGAFADWSETITELLEALTQSNTHLGPEDSLWAANDSLIGKVRSLLPEERRKPHEPN